MRDGQINQNYSFFVSDQELLISDDLLDAVRDTIRRTKNHKILHELPRALAERRDNESVHLLIQLLSDSDSTVRYWAAHSLKGNSSPELLEKLPQLIRNPKLRTTALTKLAIQNKIDGLQDIYVSLLQKDPNNSTDWYRSSLQYIAAFPRAIDKDLFISILQGKQDAFVKRFAVAGLGQLHDQNSVPLIENALRQEPPHDLNAITYLTALGKIKGAKAKQIIESYKDSKIDSVRTLAAKLLSDW
jgi:HEAT repeat protein